MKTFKPSCELIGQNGNIFNLMAIASHTLKECGMKTQANEMTTRIYNEATSYYEALSIIEEYVTVI